MEYRVNQILRFHSGEIKLSKELAKPRMHNLEHVDGDIYKVVNSITFKVGQVLEFDKKPPKQVLKSLDPIGVEKKPAAKKAAAKKAPAKKAAKK